jgi:3-oxoacyl-[acyl-carrier protein] reductase
MLGVEGIVEMLKKVPLGRMAEVSEIAELVMWLSSNKNTYISGQNIAIDGGFTRV